MDAIIPQVYSSSPVAYWRRQIFSRVFRIIAVLCIPVYLTSVYLSVVLGLWSMVVLDTVVYSMFLLAIYLPKLPDKQRYLIGCSVGYIIGIGFTVVIGPSGAGLFWLFCFPILAVLLLGKNAGANALYINGFSLAIVGMAYHLGYTKWPETVGYDIFIYVVVMINFMVTNAICTLMAGFILRRVEERLGQQALTSKLLCLALAKSAEYQDPFLYGHVLRVEQYIDILSKEILQSKQCPDEFTHEIVEDLRCACMLHDVGNIDVNQQFLLKAGRVNADEFEELKAHTITGCEFIKQLQAYGQGSEIMALAKQLSRSHHENWDGSGYPDGINGAHIPFAARVLRVCDAYDAMTSPRHYKSASSHKEAVYQLVKGKSVQFDPLVIEHFLKVEQRFEQVNKGQHH
ncbi:HD domain-containing protein [Shewanella maritima]|uniref:HD domain-containing protein n=1 Tax=Shewanella maritima TaxID=2520507 RepID=A0A411PLW8_9GAMM|nr:HD domain-containing phosphohydrolase [Shewanella maritima]QBF84526.1 HD domain-containing protein [Shewanella maritima]